MGQLTQRLLNGVMTETGLQFCPVRVRAGLAKGAWWTAFPFSSNWRCGGEPEIERALRLLRQTKGAVCWDLGAHFGIHTIGLALEVGPHGQVCAFEPDPVAFMRLQRHARMNKLDNVRLFNLAASNTDGRLKMIVAAGLGSTVTHAKYEDEVVSPEYELLSVQCVRLDTLVEAGEVKSPAFVKVDVEGHGAKALAGAASTIERALPVIVLSVHSQPEWEGSRSLLQPLGYRPRGRWPECCGADAWAAPAGLEVVILST